MRKIVIGIICTVLMTNVSGKELAGLILNGVDTLNTRTKYGFDFVQQSPCTVMVWKANSPCFMHILLYIDPMYKQYNFYVEESGYAVNMGKMNLDSIKAAPPDSVFYKQQIGILENVKVDSLSLYVGNCYILKTGVDPRRGYSMYAKIKILGFTVIDSANHEIEMRFLWVVNRSGYQDLSSSGLDTFHLGTTGINQPNSQIPSNINLTSNNQYIFKVVGDRFVLPQELVGKVKWLTVWDLRGKKVGRVEVRNERIFKLNKSTKGKDIILLRVER